MKTATVRVKLPKPGARLPEGVFHEIGDIMKSGLTAARVGLLLGGSLYIIEFEEEVS